MSEWDWSSDVFSSDLHNRYFNIHFQRLNIHFAKKKKNWHLVPLLCGHLSSVFLITFVPYENLLHCLRCILVKEEHQRNKSCSTNCQG